LKYFISWGFYIGLPDGKFFGIVGMGQSTGFMLYLLLTVSIRTLFNQFSEKFLCGGHFEMMALMHVL